MDHPCLRKNRKLAGILADKRWVRDCRTPVPSARTLVLEAVEVWELWWLWRPWLMQVWSSEGTMIDMFIIWSSVSSFWLILKWIRVYLHLRETSSANCWRLWLSFQKVQLWEAPSNSQSGISQALQHHSLFLEWIMLKNMRQQFPPKWDIVLQHKKKLNRKVKSLFLHLQSFLAKRSTTTTTKGFLRLNRIFTAEKETDLG